MRTSEERLVQEIQELNVSQDQAKVAVDNVLGLLQKADRRRIEEGHRPWNRILDNLERALDLTRARLAKYEQLLKERQRDLEQFRRSGQSGMPEQVNGLDSLEEQVLIGALRDVLPEDVPLPRDHIRAAERILEMPLEFLGNLTMEEVMRMNAQLFEEPESQRPSQDSQATITKNSWLEERIARARQARASELRRRRAQKYLRKPSPNTR